MGLFTLCSYLKTKESYDRWVTRRLWGFRHQISKAKKISKSRSHVSRSLRRTPRHCAKWLQNFHSKRTTFSQPKADFAAVQHSAFNLEWSASNGCNSLISTPNRAPFEALNFWLPELWKKTLRVSSIRGSGHVWPGKLKRPPLPSDVRRQMWNIRRR